MRPWIYTAIKKGATRIVLSNGREEILADIPVKDGDEASAELKSAVAAEEDSGDSLFVAVYCREELLGQRKIRDGRKDPSALLGQLMDHNERLGRLVTSTLPQVMAQMGRTIDAQHAQVTALLKERSDVFDMFQDLLDRGQQRDLALLKETQSLERKQEMLDTVKGYLPVLANRFLKKPGEKSPEGENKIIEALRASLDERQVSAIAKVLKPQQQLLLMELLKEEEGNNERE